MLSLGSYLLGAAELALVALSLGFSAYRLRRRLMPAWEGAPARLVEAIVAVALLIWISEILGTFGLLYAGALVGASPWWQGPSRSGRRVPVGAGIPHGAAVAAPARRGGRPPDRTRRSRRLGGC